MKNYFHILKFLFRIFILTYNTSGHELVCWASIYLYTYRALNWSVGPRSRFLHNGRLGYQPSLSFSPLHGDHIIVAAAIRAAQEISYRGGKEERRAGQKWGAAWRSTRTSTSRTGTQRGRTSS